MTDYRTVPVEDWLARWLVVFANRVANVNLKTRAVRLRETVQEAVADFPALSASPAPAGDLDDLFSRLDDILVEESPMHPFGCSTWEESSRIAIDMAKDEITRLRAAVAAMQPGWRDMESAEAEWESIMRHRIAAFGDHENGPTYRAAWHEAFLALRDLMRRQAAMQPLPAPPGVGG